VSQFPLHRTRGRWHGTKSQVNGSTSNRSIGMQDAETIRIRVISEEDLDLVEIATAGAAHAGFGFIDAAAHDAGPAGQLFEGRRTIGIHRGNAIA